MAIPAGGVPVTGWRQWLGLNASTVALLFTILLVTAATELWSPVVPQFLKALRERALAGEASTILLIGAYGFYRDGLEAVNYYVGGSLAGRFNTRRALLGFNVLPLVGLGIVLLWDSTWALFAAIPFIFVWDSLAGPAVITVVGESLPSSQRTMAFSLQSICRRVSRILAYLVSGLLIYLWGRIGGVHAAIGVAVVFVVLAIVVQHRFMTTASRDSADFARRPRGLFRQFPRELRRLLAADICARWAEGLAGPLVILYCAPIMHADLAIGTARYASILLTIQAVTNIVLYVFVGPLASREGFGKKPYIGATFVFFAAFPVSLVVFGPMLGPLGLMLAFVIGGMREIGEPARKAMIADLVPSDVRTQATGLYWSVRSAAVMLASPVGAVLWIMGDRWREGWGPVAAFGAAGVIGVVGAVMFFVRFGAEGRCVDGAAGPIAPPVS